MHDSHGRHLLGAFLKQNGLSFADAAKALFVSAPTIHDWIHGVKRPREHRRKAISIWTKGRVFEAAWETVAESATLANVRPYLASAEDTPTGTED